MKPTWVTHVIEKNETLQCNSSIFFGLDQKIVLPTSLENLNFFFLTSLYSHSHTHVRIFLVELISAYILLILCSASVGTIACIIFLFLQIKTLSFRSNQICCFRADQKISALLLFLSKEEDRSCKIFSSELLNPVLRHFIVGLVSCSKSALQSLCFRLWEDFQF